MPYIKIEEAAFQEAKLHPLHLYTLETDRKFWELSGDECPMLIVPEVPPSHVLAVGIFQVVFRERYDYSTVL